jgi:hypothetical protein
MVASMVQEIVSKLGYEVVGPAGDQPSANSLIDTTRIDAALISASLMSAAEDSAVNHLIARGIPFALITGYSDPLDYNYGQIPILPKPFTGLQIESRNPLCGNLRSAPPFSSIKHELQTQFTLPQHREHCHASSIRASPSPETNQHCRERFEAYSPGPGFSIFWRRTQER